MAKYLLGSSSEQLSDNNSKIVIRVVGDKISGKTTLTSALMSDSFQTSSKCPIHTTAQFEKPRLVTTQNGENYNVKVCDIESQNQNYDAIVEHSSAILLVFNVNVAKTFETAKKILEKINQEKSQVDSPVIMLVGSQIEKLTPLDRQVQQSTAQKFARENNLLYFEVDACSGKNIEILFDTTVTAAVSRLHQADSSHNEETPKSNDLNLFLSFILKHPTLCMTTTVSMVSTLIYLIMVITLDQGWSFGVDITQIPFNKLSTLSSVKSNEPIFNEGSPLLKSENLF